MVGRCDGDDSQGATDLTPRIRPESNALQSRLTKRNLPSMRKPSFPHPACLQPDPSFLPSKILPATIRLIVNLRKEDERDGPTRPRPSSSRPRFEGGELVAQLRSISLSMGKSSRSRKGTRLAGAQRRSDRRRSLGRPDSLTVGSAASSRLRDVDAH